MILEQRKIEMSYEFVCEDEDDQFGEAGNPAGLPMQPDTVSRSCNQKTCGISNLSCSKAGTDTGQTTGQSG